jgi:hypothetical protein
VRDVARHDREAVFRRNRGNREVEARVAKLGGKPTPAERTADVERQDAIRVDAQRAFKPEFELGREWWIDRPLPFDSSLDFPKRDRAQVKVGRRHAPDPRDYTGIAALTPCRRQHDRIKQEHLEARVPETGVHPLEFAIVGWHGKKVIGE